MPGSAGPASSIDPSGFLDSLLDPGSLGSLPGCNGGAPGSGEPLADDGVVAAVGTIEGRQVACYSEDPRYMGGSLGTAHAAAIIRVLELADERRMPVLASICSAGARLQQGVAALDAYGAIFRRMVDPAAGAPLIAVVSGASAGGASYTAALSDFVVMRREARMFLTGPRIVRSAIGEDISAERLGGTQIHERNGVSHFTCGGAADAALTVRNLLRFLPPRRGEPAPTAPPRAAGARGAQDVAAILPERPTAPYDVGDLVRAVADGGEMLEFASHWAPNMLCAFARLEGRPAGFIANQPAHLGGVIDSAASEKAAEFIERCDAFSIPLVALVDTPGFLPGHREEHRGVIRRGATLVRAFGAARVPRLTVITRKAYGGGYITMNSMGLGADLVLAWPGAEVGIMGAEMAMEIIHRRRLEEADNPRVERDRLAAEYAGRHFGLAEAVEGGFVDAVIEPGDTRGWLIAALGVLGSEAPPLILDRSRRGEGRLSRVAGVAAG